MPRLIVLNEQVGLDFRFSRAISVGRHISNGLPLPDAEISRRHACLEIHPDGTAWLSDLGSTNGTFLDSKPVTEPTKLIDRQEFSCGRSTFMLLVRDTNALGLD